MSGLFRLNLRDFINGLIMAVGGAVFTFLEQFVIAGSFKLDAVNWRLVGGVAMGAAVTYLWKNLFTTPEGKTLGIAATAPKPPPDEFAQIAAAHPTEAATVGAATVHLETGTVNAETGSGGAPVVIDLRPPLVLPPDPNDESEMLLESYKARMRKFHAPPQT